MLATLDVLASKQIARTRWKKKQNGSAKINNTFVTF